ncbi:MAG: hypothetical protein JSW47_14250, partial [Phycisphaerales bacterium]
FDLHVLATPPAFVLSQDQTLQFVSSNPPEGGHRRKLRLNTLLVYAPKVLNFLAKFLKLPATGVSCRRSCTFAANWLNC